ncbi:MAG: phospholipid carrier-dependent glycosyltransferase, partial [Solirubrobacterales bacterium]|nr:phospholipid carrier-dependent glycosyltransferase [Solirubrobacterales bacterium]
MAGGGSFAVGYAVLAGVLGACTGVAHLVVRARFAGLRGAARAVALFVVFEAALLVVHLLPAALGGLSRGAVLLVAAAALAVAFAIPRTPAVAGPERPEPPSPRWSWALAIGAWCLVLAYLAVYLQGHHANAVHHVDLLTFHLPDMARWMQDGTIWQNDQFVPLFANGNYPQHGDVSFLAVTLPFSQDSLVRLVPYPYLLATGVAVFAVARELRAPASTAALAAAALVATPVVLRPAVVASLPDAVLLMTFAAGTLFLLRHARNGRRGELVLAGVALGIALGTKWYGVSTVAIAVVVWLAARVLAGHRHRAIARDGLLVTALVAAAGGIWLVRNWAVTGNPLFPVKVPGLFDAPPDVIRERFGFSVADYLGDPAAWREHLLPDWWTAFSLAGLALLPGVLAARGRGLALAAAVPAIVLAYVITPYTALGERGDPLLIAQNARYVVPALLLAAPLTAAAVGRL